MTVELFKTFSKYSLSGEPVSFVVSWVERTDFYWCALSATRQAQAQSALGTVRQDRSDGLSKAIGRTGTAAAKLGARRLQQHAF